jgi:HmuY protein
MRFLTGLFAIRFCTLALCVIALCATSCIKSSTDSTPATPPTVSKSGNITSVKNLDASSEDRFAFFSLRTGALVASADSASDKWDIGFRKTSIIVNGGSIRAGKGAGLRLTNQTFESLRTIATSGFRTDDSESNLAFTALSGQGWYNYEATVINPIKDVTLLIRAGDGLAVAKVQIQSYYKDAVANDPLATTRFYTFRYQMANSTTQAFE